MKADTTNRYEVEVIDNSKELITIGTPSLLYEYTKYISRGSRPAKTIDSYLTNLKQFFAWLRYSCITEPTREDFDNYIKYLTSRHDAIIYDDTAKAGWSYRKVNGQRVKVTLSANTVNQYVRCAAQFFRWTALNNYYPNIGDNFFLPKVNSKQHKKSALNPSEVVTVEQSIKDTTTAKIEACEAANKDKTGRTQRAIEQSKRLTAMYSLAVNCGLRTVELSRLRVKDIQLIGNIPYITVWGKGHSEADTKKAIAKEVYKDIVDYLAVRTDNAKGEAPLFITTGNRSQGQPIAARTIGTMLKKALVEAGFNSEAYTAHSLRHSAGTNLMELTGNIYTVQQYLRHANPATTEVYIHDTNTAKEAETAEQLYNLYHGVQEKKTTADSLSALIGKMSEAQIEALKKVAETITA